jgi:NADPH-dependent curcumin reductase CurA
VVKSVSLRPEEVPIVARVNRQILLKSRLEGAPSLDNFTLKQGSVPEPGDGEVLMRTHWLSLDPHMRGRMGADITAYAATGGTPGVNERKCCASG